MIKHIIGGDFFIDRDYPKLSIKHLAFKNVYTLNLQTTCADREYCPDPYVVATRARRNPGCISLAADNALPFHRTETNSSIPFSVIPPHYRVRCKFKHMRK